jgi:L-cysteate sulfo-lyase
MNLEKLPRVKLGFFPTPVEALTRLSAALGGPRIFIKRDDLSGLAFGGNKVRKLEFLVGEARARGADSLITAGALQSNHCRQTAAAAARCGLECHLVLGGSEPEIPEGNLLLDKLLGATIHYSDAGRKGEAIDNVAASIKKSGGRPYIIPYGGSNAVGGVGFAAAMLEVVEQMKATGLTYDRIVFPTSSGGTQAGMVVGAAISGYTGTLTGIRIDKDDPLDLPFRQLLPELAGEIAQHLGISDTFHEAFFDVRENYLGEGYGIPGKLEREALALLARTEGILLDPVYTGRALGGMVDLIRTGQIGSSEKVLFWHTGGSPALFAYSPKALF